MNSRQILRSRGNVDATTRADQEQKRQKRAATHDAYRVANQQRIAARRALGWIGMSKSQLVFRYEITDMFTIIIKWLPDIQFVIADTYIVG